MTNELYINNVDASTYGVKMGDNFLENILAPVPLKDMPENKDITLDGKQVDTSSPHVDERTVSLTFNIEGTSQANYLSNFRALCTEFKKGYIVIYVPVWGEYYKLIYKKYTSFGVNTERIFSKLIVDFDEPNPADRTKPSGWT